MNIKILDSWLRDYLKTNATPKEIAEKLSLSSVSVERLEKVGNDLSYDIEVTTNRPDLMSIVGLAREAAAVLNTNNIKATFVPPRVILNSFQDLKKKMPKQVRHDNLISITNDPKLVNRILAVVMEVTVKDSPKTITNRLEATDIRSLNNLIDVTNYVMRTIGHPTHVFDFDRLATETLTIRESKPGEQIKTLDNKMHTLPGGDIVAINDKGEIVDLLGIMGLENSVVTEKTKRILFFIDNNDPIRQRKTSMALGIRTDAAVINEKQIDPELAMEALLLGIKLFEETADGKIISEIIDIYPNKPKTKTVTVSEQQITDTIGVTIPLQKAANILERLGFQTTTNTSSIYAIVPTFRVNDISIPEDIIEEIARIYGYHNIPNILPPLPRKLIEHTTDTFFWENRLKDTLKYWGFTENYTYSMVSKELFGEDTKSAVTMQNPLSEDMVYLRKTLIPSLLDVVHKNNNEDTIRIFELANVYHKKENNLPNELLKLAGVIKKAHVSFYEVKGLIEQLMAEVGIPHLSWKIMTEGDGATIMIEKKQLGVIRIIDKKTITFELDFATIVAHATVHRIYKPVSKYPPIVEDLAVVAPRNILTGDLMETIKKQSPLIQEVSLLDKYEDTRTFHIVYQSYHKNLTDKEVGEIRTKILHILKQKYAAKIK